MIDRGVEEGQIDDKSKAVNVAAKKLAPNNPHLPDIEEVGPVTGDNPGTLYRMVKYTVPIKKGSPAHKQLLAFQREYEQLGSAWYKRAVEKANTLRKTDRKAAEDLFDPKHNASVGLEHLAKIEAGGRVDKKLVEAVKALLQAAKTSAPEMTFEFGKLDNFGTDKKGNLVLLDFMYDPRTMW